MIKKLFCKFKRLILKIKISFVKNSVYYVNGADTLPPPLDQEVEDGLVDRIYDQTSRDILIEHNLRLVVFIAKRFENVGIGIEELVSIGTVGLIKAISTFNKDKNIKLATYASRCIENEILMYIRKNQGRKREVSIDEPLSVDWDGNELLLSDILGSEADNISRELEEDEERRLIREAVNDLNERERTIIEMRFGLISGKELTQKEVADILGIKPIRRTSGEVFAVCPFCNDRRGKFSYIIAKDNKKDMFHCFKCETGGSKYKLYALANGEHYDESKKAEYRKRILAELGQTVSIRPTYQAVEYVSEEAEKADEIYCSKVYEEMLNISTKIK